MPDFLVIGAQKAGTSSLYRYLQAHPEIFMSKVKEPKYFCSNGNGLNFQAPISLPEKVAYFPDKSKYLELFRDAPEEVLLGEASTWYLHDEGASKMISESIPQAKLIAILRDPIERAYSNFFHARDYLGIEPVDEFERAIKLESERRQMNWGHPWYYASKGLYHQHLSRFYKNFSAEQICICLTDDLKANPLGLMQRLYRFLGVDPEFSPNFNRKFNVSSSKARSKVLHRFLNEPRKIKALLRPLIPASGRQWLKKGLSQTNRKKDVVEPALREQLIEYYRQDIKRLEELIERDLSQWLASL